ncbi:hypothetical protein ACM66B_006801 [Microbotryomycetes sp. NB124-2]
MSSTSSSVPWMPSASTVSSESISMSATVYYGAVGVAVALILFISLGLRILYIRRARERALTERADIERRGEAQGLPTYTETATPYTLSYLPTPRFLGGSATRGTQATQSNNDTPSITLAQPTPALLSSSRRQTCDDVSPPTYDGPPKYED